MTGRMEEAGRLTELIPVLCLIESEHGFEGIAGLERCPIDGDHILFGEAYSGALFEGNKFLILRISLILQRSKGIRDNRSMPCRTDCKLHRISANDIDGFFSCFEINPLTVYLVLIWIFWIHFFDKQIHHVFISKCESPGNVVVMSQENTGCACQ